MDIVPQWSVTLACLAGDCSIGGHASVGAGAVCCLFVGWYTVVYREASIPLIGYMGSMIL